MRKMLYIVSAVFALCGCDRISDERIFTDVTFAVAPPEGVECVRMQATLTLADVNTGQTYASSSFSGAQISLRVLRGLYNLTLEGEMQCRVDGGALQSRRVIRKTSDPAMLVNMTEQLDLPVQLK